MGLRDIQAQLLLFRLNLHQGLFNLCLRVLFQELILDLRVRLVFFLLFFCNILLLIFYCLVIFFQGYELGNQFIHRIVQALDCRSVYKIDFIFSNCESFARIIVPSNSPQTLLQINFTLKSLCNN